MKILSYSQFLNESNQVFPHEIKSELYWKQILKGNDFVLKMLDTIMKKQKGFASDRQMEVLKRAQRGDRTPYHPKN